MDRRFLTVLAVSLAFALVTSAIIYQLMSRGASGAPPPPKPTSTKDVVVAAKPLALGITIKAADVKLVKLPQEQAAKGSFSKIEEVEGRSVMSNILEDEPVLEARLAARGSGLGLAPVIPIGMRAVAVRVNDVAGVSGFVLPGMRVDVLVTGRPPAHDNTVTTTCLQNILVLTAGQTMQPDSKGQAMPAATVTLLASPEQAEILTLANQEGHIQLVLRNGADSTIQPTPGREVAELYGGRSRRAVSSEPRRPRTELRSTDAKPVPPPPPPPPDQIVVIRGNQKTVETLNR